MAVSNEASGIIKFTAAADAFSEGVSISKIRWVGATTAGHGLVIDDADGKEILTSVAVAENYVESVDFVPALIVQGITVSTLGSGTVYVYG